MQCTKIVYDPFFFSIIYTLLMPLRLNSCYLFKFEVTEYYSWRFYAIYSSEHITEQVECYPSHF